jgi:hypothetical protein
VPLQSADVPASLRLCTPTALGERRVSSGEKDSEWRMKKTANGELRIVHGAGLGGGGSETRSRCFTGVETQNEEPFAGLDGTW